MQEIERHLGGRESSIYIETEWTQKVVERYPHLPFVLPLSSVNLPRPCDYDNATMARCPSFGMDTQIHWIWFGRAPQCCSEELVEDVNVLRERCAVLTCLRTWQFRLPIFHSNVVLGVGSLMIWPNLPDPMFLRHSPCQPLPALALADLWVFQCVFGLSQFLRGLTTWQAFQLQYW